MTPQGALLAAISFQLLFAFVGPAIGRDLSSQSVPDESNLDRHGYYTNVDGDQVHQPAKSLAATATTVSVNTTLAPARSMAALPNGFLF
jgi:hypothetical protein